MREITIYDFLFQVIINALIPQLSHTYYKIYLITFRMEMKNASTIQQPDQRTKTAKGHNWYTTRRHYPKPRSELYGWTLNKKLVLLH